MGVRKTYCACSRNDVRPLTSRSNSMPSKRRESLPLKELDFGLQKPTGPSAGVVASIVLIIIALSSVSFLFFYITHTPFRLYWKILYFEPLFWDFSMFKKSKLCQKVLIFISLVGLVLLFHMNT